MAALAVLGGLIGGALVLATLRSKRNSKKESHIQTFKIR
jgi:membrane associated rhomboid family serine protease